MGKSKAKNTSQGGGASHLRARIEYLQKAANYLHTASAVTRKPNKPGGQSLDHRTGVSVSDPAVPVSNTASGEHSENADNPSHHQKAITASLSRQYVSQMRGVSLKTQLRLPVDVKRSFCKRCDLLLVPGVNCVHEVRNGSKGCKKPWADVLVVRCNACETEKRFPQTTKRSKKLVERRKEMETRRVQEKASET